MNRNKTLIARVIAALAAVAVIATVFASAAPAFAAPAPQSPKYFDRKGAVKSAAAWTGKHVPYSQTDWLDGYRTDCSGLISKAWRLDQSYVTWSLPEISKRISKEQLLPGDIILNTERHVILFGGWTDKQHTNYVAYEQVGGAFHQATRRVVSYPYDSPTADSYKPYRYTGGHSLDAPGNKLPRPLVQTYAGGSPLVPGPQAAAQNAKTKQIAAKRGAVAKAKDLAVKRAKAAAAKKAAEARAAAQTPAPLNTLVVKPTRQADSIAGSVLGHILSALGL